MSSFGVFPDYSSCTTVDGLYSDGVDGMILDFKSLTREELKDLRKQKKPRANDTSVNMATALEAFRCSAVAAPADGSAVEDADEDVEDDED